MRNLSWDQGGARVRAAAQFRPTLVELQGNLILRADLAGFAISTGALHPAPPKFTSKPCHRMVVLTEYFRIEYASFRHLRRA